MRRLLSLLLVVALGLPSIAWTCSPDDVVLTVQRGSNLHEVALSWNGGSGPYRIYRAAGPADLAQPSHQVASVAGTSYAEGTFGQSVLFYQVAPDPGASPVPVIESITPAGAKFGDVITVTGCGFGTDRHAVHVRFTYTEGGETLVATQPVYWTTGTRLSLMMPIAVTARVNNVEVVVDAAVSAPVPYFVGGPLPDDPTPAVSGNEILAFIDQLDEMVSRFDSKLDRWYVETGTLGQADVEMLHGKMAEIRAAVAQMRTVTAGQPQGTLAVLDVLAGTPGFAVLKSRLDEAVGALQGSPLGTVMCEGNNFRDVVYDILDVVDVVTEIIDTIITVLNDACAGSVLLAIITAGATSPLAVLICSAAAIANTFIRPVVDAIASTSSLLRRLAETAPTDPTPNTFAQRVEHPLWGADPPVVYVEGNLDLTARATNSFSNEACRNGGCPFDVTVTIYEISITITIDVPYVTIPDLPVRCKLTFPAGAGGYSGFTDLGSPDDGTSCHFTGADVHDVGWERGLFPVETSSQCGRDLLGPLTRNFPLVSGPRLYSVAPATGQLGSLVTLTGEYLPPNNVVNNLNAASTEYGDARWIITGTAGPNVYRSRIGDTAATEASVGLRVQGRDAIWAQPFTVLPPVLDFAVFNPAFPGEDVVIHGTGFASNPALNVVTLDDTPVPTVGLEPAGPVFNVPAWAGAGNLRVDSVGHASNTIPFATLHWGPGTRLSHPDRDAANPALAVAGDGTVGVAWIDRHQDGGEARLLFTDAVAADVAFRAPVEIAATGGGLETLAGWPSAPQQPSVAVGPGRQFHVAWINAAGELRLTSFAKGTTIPPSVLVAAPPAGSSYRDPAVAAMADGSVHVAAVRIAHDGDPRNTLVQVRSTDAGATFSPPVAFAGPGITPAPDDFHLGDVDLAVAAGRLWRAYAGLSSACGWGSGLAAVREIFTQSSLDGVTWTAPEAAGACTTDLPHAGLASARRGAPSVSGDALGALVAWDGPTTTAYNPNGPTDIYASRKVAANGAPYDAFAVKELTPSTWSYQTDGGRPSLVDRGPSAGTMVAWEQRDPGTSPDMMTGVPRVHFQRFRDHMASAAFPVDQTPTAAAGDSTTIDTRPVLGSDDGSFPYLVWLRGPAGHRTVQFMSTTGVNYLDTLAGNPPKIAAPPRQLLAATMLTAWFDGVIAPVGGTLLVDPQRPGETRWVGTDFIGPSGQGGRTRFTSDGSILLYGSADYYAPTLADPAGNTRLLAGDDLLAGDITQRLWSARPAADGSFFAVRPVTIIPGWNEYTIARNAPGSAHFARVGDFTLPGGAFEVSHSANLVAFGGGESGTEIYDIAADTTSAPIPDTANDMAWSPMTEALAYTYYDWQNGCPSDPFSSCQALAVWDAATQASTVLSHAGEIGPYIAWKPDGSDIAFVCSGLDCCAPGPSVICTTGGLAVPTEPGMFDSAPRWSPDGSSIAFVRYDGNGESTRHLMVWQVGDPAATALVGPVLGQFGPSWSPQLNEIDWIAVTP